jgi:hypothetical protein
MRAPRNTAPIRAIGLALLLAAAAAVLALGDAVRALRCVGLDGDARRLVLEALLPAWLRGTR